MSRFAPMLGLSLLALLVFTATAPAQLVMKSSVTRTGSTRVRPVETRPRYDAALLPPSNTSNATAGRYDFLRDALPAEVRTARPVQSKGFQVRRASFQQPLQLPAPPTERIFRGQEPADQRPRLNGVPGEIVREEIVPADQRPRLNSPPDVFRDRPRSVAPAPNCQSPTYYPGRVVSRPGLGRPVNTTHYNAPQNPGVVESRYQVGRGIIGQPTLYVQKQPIRNFIRWLTF